MWLQGGPHTDTTAAHSRFSRLHTLLILIRMTYIILTLTSAPLHPNAQATTRTRARPPKRQAVEYGTCAPSLPLCGICGWPTSIWAHPITYNSLHISKSSLFTLSFIYDTTYHFMFIRNFLSSPEITSLVCRVYAVVIYLYTPPLHNHMYRYRTIHTFI